MGCMRAAGYADGATGACCVCSLQVLLYGRNCRRNVFQRQVFIYGSCTSCSNSQPAESGGVPPAATGRRAPLA